MARKKQQQSEATDTTNGTIDVKSGPPKGMTKRSAQNADGWVLKQAGAVVYGQVQGRYKRIGQEAYYYQVRLMAECEIAKAKGVVEVAEPGEVVNLDEVGDIKTLADAAAAGERIAWVRFEGKERQKRDPSKTFWKVEVHTSAEEIAF